MPAPPLIGLLEFAAGTRTCVPLAAFDARRLDWAITTGLGPLLHEAATSDPDAHRSPGWPRVEAAMLSSRVVTGELLDAAGDVLEACTRRGLVVTLLKGISVCEQYYPQPHLRLMRDIDLLVADETLPAADALLRALGWEPRSVRPEAFYEAHHHGTPLFHPQRHVWIELHRRLMPPEGELARERVFTTQSVAGEIRPSVFRGRPATRLSDELQLVYLAVHWGRHFHAKGGLFAMLDAIHLLRAAGARLDWSRVMGWLRGSAAAAPLLVLLTYLARHGITLVPAEALRDLQGCQRGLGDVNLRLAHTLIDLYMVDGRPHGRLLSGARVGRVWRTLLASGSPSGNLARIPGAMLSRRRRR
jgi:hypothetical protein